MKRNRKALFTRALASAIAALAILLCSPAFGADSANEITKGVTNSTSESQHDSAAAKEKEKPEASSEPQMSQPNILSKAMLRGSITGGTDPHGDSLLSIQNSLQQFAHPEFMLRLFLSLTLAVGCAWAVAWHPRRATLVDPLSDFEERKTLIILGVVGSGTGSPP